nr:hypothetical protein CCFAOBFC_00046 [Haslea ostrearia]
MRYLSVYHNIYLKRLTSKGAKAHIRMHLVKVGVKNYLV